MKKKHESFSEIIEQLGRRHSVQAVFSDFLTLCICAFSFGTKEEDYHKIMRKYEKPEAYRISEALGALTIEMTGDGTGLVDVLGEYFMMNISHGHNGHFFTPMHICDLMASINQPALPPKTILDPTSGSGRMLLAMAKINRFAKFYGADVDLDCAKMTVLNLVMNNLSGEVAWMNSLTNEFYRAWAIERTIYGICKVKEISQTQSEIYLEHPKKQVLEIEKSSPVVLMKNQVQTQLHFEF